ncbi:hypothetical protein [Candidatus Tisiphia endosymbiont of Metellina segmentata]|uniref:hypothetical protein n=1 Tax=Candidatus Tisiphia endosymbiont of Metellina segmentata TaxID=3066274 RepID=UPI00313C2C94
MNRGNDYAINRNGYAIKKKITDFSPYLKDGVLKLNQEGNKLSGGKGEIGCFDKIFDIGQLAKFIETTPDIMELNAANCGIGKMDINNFQSLMDAIKKSKIIAVNFENNTLSSPGMVEEISNLSKIYKLFKIFKIFKFSEISKITTLNLGGCDIDDKKITKIAENLCNIVTLNVVNNHITDEGVGAIAKHLPDLLALYASCNSITDKGADKIAKGFKKIEILIFPAYNDISYEGIKGVVIAHRDTLTVFDAGFYGCSKLQVWELGNLLPNCVFKLGLYWTRGVNDNNEAPLNLNGVVWGNPPVVPVWGNLLPVDHVEVVEGDNNAPALIVPVGENNNALLPVDLVGVVENLQG